MVRCCRCNYALPTYKFTRNQLSKVESKCRRCVDIEQEHRRDHNYNSYQIETMVDFERSGNSETTTLTSASDDDDDSDDDDEYNQDTSSSSDEHAPHHRHFHHHPFGHHHHHHARGHHHEPTMDEFTEMLASFAHEARQREQQQRRERKAEEASSPTERRKREEEARAAQNPQRSKTVTNFHENVTRTSLREELVCIVCYEEMSVESDCDYRCIILGCSGSHTICFGCWCKMKKNARESDDWEVQDRRGVPCPICREPVHAAVEIPRSLRGLIQLKMKERPTTSSNNHNNNSHQNTANSSKHVTYPTTNTNRSSSSFRQPRNMSQRRRAPSSRNHNNNHNRAQSRTFSSRPPAQQQQQQNRHRSQSRPANTTATRRYINDDDSSSDNNDGMDYSRLQNLTTGYINNINHRKRCGGVTLDEVGESMIFFFRECPRISELNVGDFVKCRVRENPIRPGDLIACELAPIS